MNELETIQLITRVLANEASMEEQQQLELWRRQDARNELQYTEMLHIWNNAAPADVDTAMAWEKFSNKLEQEPKRFKLNSLLRIAAAVILVSGLGLYLGSKMGGASYETIQTASNQVKEITLPDGSIAWLNQGSSLTYEKSFKGEMRSVTLDGEAFFEVVKNPEKPFVITSDQSVTRVLGTSFNLNTRKGSEALLTVVTGKVSFMASSTKEEVIVMADESAIIDQLGHAIKDVKEDKNALSWKTNTLSFNDASLEEVFKSLDHYFNIHISVENKHIYTCHFTGEFVKPTFKQVMDVIGKTLQLTYEQKGKEVLVKGKGCE
ncbi:MAG: FecR domain-containing protein [Bacteroidota bacterium]